MPDDLTTARSQGSVRGSQVENVSSLVAGEDEEAFTIRRESLIGHRGGELVFPLDLRVAKFIEIEFSGGGGDRKLPCPRVQRRREAEQMHRLFSGGERID